MESRILYAGIACFMGLLNGRGARRRSLRLSSVQLGLKLIACYLQITHTTRRPARFCSSAYSGQLLLACVIYINRSVTARVLSASPFRDPAGSERS